MIKVVYDRKGLSLSMEGHAGAGESGRDLVCAAASMLAHTLAEAAERLYECGIAGDYLAELSPGRAEIAVEPRLGYKAGARLVFDAVCGGFRLLARDYGENISFELKNASAF